MHLACISRDTSQCAACDVDCLDLVPFNGLPCMGLSKGLTNGPIKGPAKGLQACALVCLHVSAA